MAEMDLSSTQPAANEAVSAENAYCSYVLLMDAHNELLQRQSKGAEREDYLTAIQDFLKKAQATGAVLQHPDERYTAQSLLNYWTTVLYRADITYSDELTLASYDPRINVEIEDEDCPYPGVRAFKEEEQKFFFGRQRTINYMLSRLREDRLLALVGPSGSGKTSLVLAGLIPELKLTDGNNNIQRYYFQAITPGAQPVEALVKLAEREGLALPANGQKWDFHNDPSQLLKLIKQLTPLPVVIVIDQYQQIFSLASQQDRQAFNRNIEQVIRAPETSHIVIVTMRSGNYDSYFPRPEEFRKIMDPATVSLAPPGSLEIREVIEKPGGYVGIKFSDDTVKALVAETLSEATGLPLLQFTLVKLWEAHAKNEDVNEAFAKLGSCHAALQNSADHFYNSLEFLEQLSCARMLKRLIRVDSDLRVIAIPATRAQLYHPADTKARVDSLIDRLTKQQLLRFTSGPRPEDDEVELAHRSLLRTWHRMADWADTKKLTRQLQRFVGRAAIAAVIAMIALFIFIMIGRKQQTDNSRELARLSSKQAAYGRFDMALLLGREAYALEDNSTTRSNSLRLLHALQSTSHPKAFLYQKGFRSEDLVFSAEDHPSRLAAIDGEGNIIIWNLGASASEAAASKILPAASATQVPTYPMVFSSNNKLATASRDNGPVIVWDIAREELMYLPADGRKITSLMFGIDNTLITANDIGNVVRWDLSDRDTPKRTNLYQHKGGGVNGLSWRNKDNLLASAGDDGTVVLWDLGTNKRLRTFSVDTQTGPDSNKGMGSVAFSAQSELIAGGGWNEAYVWDLTNGEMLGQYGTDPRFPTWILVSLSEDGRRLSGFSFRTGLIPKSGLTVWNVEDHSTGARQFYEPEWSNSAAFSNDGSLLALPDEDGVLVWNVFSDRVVEAESRVSNIAFSPKNKLLASTGPDSTLTLWKETSATKYEQVGNTLVDPGGVATLSFSADGQVLALGTQNGKVALRDTRENKHLRVLDVATSMVSHDTSDSSKASPEVSQDENADTETPANPISVLQVVFDPQFKSRRLAAVVSVPQPPVDNKLVDPKSRIIVWDTNTEAVSAYTDVGHVTSLAFSSDDSTLAWGRSDEVEDAAGKKIKTFKIDLRKANGDQLDDFQPGDEVRSLAFNRDGDILAAGLANGKIELWKVSTGRHTREPLLGSSGEVTDLVFSPNGKILAAAMNSKVQAAKRGLIELWDVDSGEQIGNHLIGHEGTLSTLAFSCDGKTLASGSEGFSEIVLWDFDLEGANNRFCSVVDCRRELIDPAARFKKRSFFQNLYTRFQNFSSWVVNRIPWRISPDCCGCTGSD